MKCLRITGSPLTRSYDVAVVGENRMKPDEDTQNTIMQILRLKMRWKIIDEQAEQNNAFNYYFGITF